MDKLIEFIRGLQETGTHFTLAYDKVPGTQPAAITVNVAPWAGALWEVEFFDDGTVEIERFATVDGVRDATVDELVTELRTKR